MPDRRKTVHILLIAALLAILAVGTRQILRDANRPVLVPHEPWKLMGTRTELFVVVARRHAPLARATLARTEHRLRDIEAAMSVHLDASPISLLNAAGADEPVELPESLVALLKRAGELEAETDGAFDATCRPVLNLWKAAAKTDREPTDDDIARARKLMGMRRLTIDGTRVVKSVAGLQVDLGGLAKGWAVDEAFTAIGAALDADGVLVNIGGDLRCIGVNRYGKPWGIGIQHPFITGGTCGRMTLTDAAVATSGDYERFVEINGRRYSHILDPRTGRPVESTPSVTVVSLPANGRPPSAAEADAWATALSVLGPDGLKKLAGRPDLEAMIVTGVPGESRIHMTAGFRRLLAEGTDIELD